jgi:hypothetical protein
VSGDPGRTRSPHEINSLRCLTVQKMGTKTKQNLNGCLTFSRTKGRLAAAQFPVGSASSRGLEIRYSGDVTMSFRRACLVRRQLLGRAIGRRPLVIPFDVLL